MSSENLKLTIKDIDDLLRCLNLASLLEVSGWPKPGNVHRRKDFQDTRFEHFLSSIAAIQPNFREFCRNVHRYSLNIGEDYSFVKLGYFFREAAKEMMKWQKGGNVILGHILILSPLAAAATICLKSGFNKFKNFAFNVKKVISDTSVKDTVNLYEAILACNPGGLGKVEKYDLNDPNVLKDLQKDKITLKEIFELSKDIDLISNEYASGFNIILSEGLPYFFKIFKETNDINTATVNTFLKILADHPDTLIIRKSGIDSAKAVSEQAKRLVQLGGITSEEGLNLCYEFDTALHEQKGSLNPGTTADLVAGVIFCALIFGLRF